MDPLTETSDEHGYDHEPGAGIWVQPPSPLTQVCAVTDNTTPRAVRAALIERFGDVPQFALLHLDAPEQQRLAWMSSCLGAVRAERRGQRRIDGLLALLSASCRLLLCTQSARSLDWLGSVCGHRCAFASLHAITSDDRQNEVAVETVRALLHETLAERWGSAL
ncbi:hypothetical protein [Paraburkholderia sp. BL10I2N1]|uniref:hypothetical protein n=1 Tax=Paraburkholderia sp. BL10I2N1 TaxID=1938796 RepID=UPI0010600015|nr:hypothetical protein [Paraburkholderia sp. BL10I2N1]TDN62657.1 hypothetical protein B0G77_6243 [Paraburkholderia sp. BL10I2N1]